MSLHCPEVFAADNLSHAWGRALCAVYASRKRNAPPLVLSVHGFDGELPPEDPDIRRRTDALLARLDKVPIRVSALTIFPYAAWERRDRPPCYEFSDFCVTRLLPRLKRLDRRNRLGTYFERMMAFTGSRAGDALVVNQLDHVIGLLRDRKRWPRESALQLACFDPAKDHTRQPVRGFPCLQQVGVAHDGAGAIAINAYYPTQYVFDRGYGNYLGLCHLGVCIAHEAGLRFARLNCFIGRPELGGVSKADLRDLVRRIERRLQIGSGGDQHG